MTKEKPFENKVHLSGSDVEALADWLATLPQDIQLTSKYTIKDLVEDLNSISDSIWSDGIDAMGEDA